MNGFAHVEGALAENLGLARGTLRELRDAQLSRGTDWKIDRGEVRYSDAGREKLLGLLKISSADVQPAAASPASSEAPHGVLDGVDGPFLTRPLDPLAAPKPGEERELIVTKKYINRAIVQAKLGTVFVRVRVKDSRTLKTGMFIRCQWITEDLWKMTQRLPRAHARP